MTTGSRCMGTAELNVSLRSLGMVVRRMDSHDSVRCAQLTASSPPALVNSPCCQYRSAATLTARIGCSGPVQRPHHKKELGHLVYGSSGTERRQDRTSEYSGWSAGSASAGSAASSASRCRYGYPLAPETSSSAARQTANCATPRWPRMAARSRLCNTVSWSRFSAAPATAHGCGRDFEYTNVPRQHKLSDSFCCLLLQ